MKVALRDPGRTEAMPIGMNDLLGGEPVSVCRAGLVKEPAEETQPFRFDHCRDRPSPNAAGLSTAAVAVQQRRGDRLPLGKIRCEF
jgi:hypothetical protein